MLGKKYRMFALLRNFFSQWAGEHFIFWDESFGPLRVNPLFTFNYTANYDGVYGWYYQIGVI